MRDATPAPEPTEEQRTAAYVFLNKHVGERIACYRAERDAVEADLAALLSRREREAVERERGRILGIVNGEHRHNSPVRARIIERMYPPAETEGRP